MVPKPKVGNHAPAPARYFGVGPSVLVMAGTVRPPASGVRVDSSVARQISAAYALLTGIPEIPESPMPSDRQRHRDRHKAALDLIEAWTQGEDADLSNIADSLAQEPQAARYALARIMDVALRSWAEDAHLDQAQVFAVLRSKIERDLAENPYGGW